MNIQMNALRFSYGSREVLKDISFSVEAGELLCVLGPNGVGKSTLFRCILGLQKGYEGEILIDGQRQQALSPAKLAKKVAYIPQHYAPTFDYSVLHTVLMGTTAQIGLFASPGKRQEEQALAALEQFGIAHLCDRSCARISGGERQLALIARAVVQQAPILIMDEPTANLDYGNQIRVMEQVERLAQQGYLVILSTHNPEHALLYASKAMVLLEGKILRIGSPEEVVTEELLRKVYHVDVRIETVQAGGRKVKVCIPSNSKRGKDQ